MGLKNNCLGLLASATNSSLLVGSTHLCEVSFSPMITMNKCSNKQFISRPSGDSLVVQWLGLGVLTAGAWVQSLVGELRSHNLHGAAKIEKKKVDLQITFSVKPKFSKQTSYGLFIVHKGTRAFRWRKDSLFKKWCCNNWTSVCKKDVSQLIPYTIYKN